MFNNYSGIQIAQQPQIYGPQRVIDLNSIHKQLACFNLSSSQILMMAKDALLHGHMLSEKMLIFGQYCHQIVHQNLIFILSQAFDAVITIHGTPQYFKCSRANDKFAVQRQSSDEISFERELVDEIVTDLFENDDTFISENSNVLLPKLSDVHAVSSFYSNSSLSDAGEEEYEEEEESLSSDESQSRRDYHTIYMKRIIERLEKQTDSKTFSAEYIIRIVDNAIKKGIKRKISKRTFEFKWDVYTIIMSKSLKTILDFAISPNANDDSAITVHPDVVSIITKRHKFLNYFSIQKLAKEAKLSGMVSTKKKDYRQQFVYEYSGFRVVFASNHSTIVEMEMMKE